MTILGSKGNIIYDSKLFSQRTNFCNEKCTIPAHASYFCFSFSLDREIKMPRNTIFPKKSAKFSCRESFMQ